MSDKRSHRGPHPDDAKLFGESALPALRSAAADFCWLLNHGYASQSALKLVGDRHRLTKRQRLAIARSVCDDASLASRANRQLAPTDLAGATLLVDGFNVLVTIEAALAGGVVLAARDGCYRDMASMHGTYRKVAETAQALIIIGNTLASLDLAACRWLIDRPVSNSGRVRAVAEDLARQHGWNWEVALVPDPDPDLIDSKSPIASADSSVLDRCQLWFNLARCVVQKEISTARVVSFCG